ncbi:MAG: FAD-dependent monooxygenase [Planctomycetota bacterium]|nr:FAD-dependent monooxygenase [Planctomycetota bacterium]
MDVVCIGAGPASLYTAILLKKLDPGISIRLYEQNRPDDTFGWGVVFSDETLAHFEEADPETYHAIRAEFVYWTDIDTYYRDTLVRSTGHGFCGMARKRLLEILHERCAALGIPIEFEHTIEDVRPLLGADLIVAGDGINSLVRTTFAEHFRPSLDWRKCKFTWLGTTKPLDAFTFIFRANEHGLFQVHAYPFQDGLSTFIVECREETWRRAGLESATEEETVAYVAALFADHLDGHKLLTNRSIWRTFPTVRNEKWHHDNIVLIGDAAHTAHFSIGSGTKLAMEDAIALVQAIRDHGLGDVPGVLAAYEAARRETTEKIQHAAQTSLEWFEHSARYLDQSPLQFTFNLMTRSKRITYDNLARRDPELVDRCTAEFAAEAGLAIGPTAWPPPPALTPYRVRDLELANRIAVSAMCQYSATDGVPDDWHLVHYGSFATGGAGLVMTEMTCVSPEARITAGCTGLWSDAQEGAWKRIVDWMKSNGPARVGLQLGHAGRKGSCTLPWQGDRPLRDASAWTVLAPSAIPFRADGPTPREMTRADMDVVVAQHVAAAQRALRVGFDLIELHMAHGYLLSSFISPLANQRTDEYGGSLDNRMRFPLEVLEAVRGVLPAGMPCFVRISASDWLDDEGGLTEHDAVDVSRMLQAGGADAIDVSSAYVTPHSEPVYGRMYQVPFADRIRHAVGVPVMAVGGIAGIDHANTIVGAGRADLCAIARGHLLNPHLTLEGIARYRDGLQPFPRQYGPARPPPREGPAQP